MSLRGFRIKRKRKKIKKMKRRKKRKGIHFCKLEVAVYPSFEL